MGNNEQVSVGGLSDSRSLDEAWTVSITPTADAAVPTGLLDACLHPVPSFPLVLDSNHPLWPLPQPCPPHPNLSAPARARRRRPPPPGSQLPPALEPPATGPGSPSTGAPRPPSNSSSSICLLAVPLQHIPWVGTASADPSGLGNFDCLHLRLLVSKP